VKEEEEEAHLHLPCGPPRIANVPQGLLKWRHKSHSELPGPLEAPGWEHKRVKEAGRPVTATEDTQWQQLPSLDCVHITGTPGTSGMGEFSLIGSKQ
jgi:hypothetical protein